MFNFIVRIWSKLLLVVGGEWVWSVQIKPILVTDQLIQVIDYLCFQARVTCQLTMETLDAFAIGDYCFAQAKTFPWWPSLIVNRQERKSKKGSKILFSVVFFGTNGSALVPPSDLKSLTPESIKDCVTKTALKRKYYKEGFKEMISLSGFHEKDKLLVEEVKLSQEKYEAEQNSIAEERFVKERFLSYLDLTPVPAEASLAARQDEASLPPQQAEASPLDPLQAEASTSEFKITNSALDLDLIDEFEPVKIVCLMNQIVESYFCEDCSIKFVCETTFEMHKYREHSRVNAEDELDEDGIYFGNSKRTNQSEISRVSLTAEDVTGVTKTKKKVKSPSLPSIKSKTVKSKSKKQKGNSRLVRSLREDEMEGNKVFIENVEIRDNYFFCKLCSKYSSTVKLLARSHVVSCGKVKRKGRPAKETECLQCQEKFSSRKEMLKHHINEHSTQKYSCSTCHKTFTRRQAYRRHLVSHTEAPKLHCPRSDCSKTFRYTCNLKRHVKTHRNPLSTVDSARYQENDNFISFEIDLEERWKGRSSSGTLTVKELPSSKSKYKRNHTSFQDNLGFSSLEEWDSHVEVSNILGLPVSDSADPEAVEVCFFVDELGSESCKFAWSSMKQSRTTIEPQRVSSLANDVVEPSSVDKDVSDEDFLHIVDSIIKVSGYHKDGMVLDPPVKSSGLGEQFDLCEGWYNLISFCVI